jgi:hypothetical protein
MAPSHRTPFPSLKDLGVFSKSGLPSPGSSGTQTGNEEGRQSTYGFESQLTTRTSPILSYLFHRLDGGFGYPSELYTAGISGEVTAKLSFNDQGQWNDSTADIKGSSNFLRVYMIHRLREILAEAIAENIWKADPRAFSVEARFIFDIVAPETVVGAQKGPQFAPSVDPTRLNSVDTDGGILDTLQALEKCWIIQHQCAADQVAMARNILGRTVHHDIGTEFEWALKDGRRKGVIHDGEYALFLRVC